MVPCIRAKIRQKGSKGKHSGPFEDIERHVVLGRWQVVKPVKRKFRPAA